MVFHEIVKHLSLADFIFFVNEKKKTVVLVVDYGEDVKKDTYVVKCHAQDTFDLITGIGLAISQCYAGSKKHSAMRELLRNSKRRLDYKTYAKWCVLDFFEYNFDYDKFINNHLYENVIVKFQN